MVTETASTRPGHAVENIAAAARDAEIVVVGSSRDLVTISSGRCTSPTMIASAVRSVGRRRLVDHREDVTR
jgi:hypothetical protein